MFSCTKKIFTASVNSFEAFVLSSHQAHILVENLSFYWHFIAVYFGTMIVLRKAENNSYELKNLPISNKGYFCISRKRNHHLHLWLRVKTLKSIPLESQLGEGQATASGKEATRWSFTLHLCQEIWLRACTCAGPAQASPDSSKWGTQWCSFLKMVCWAFSSDVYSDHTGYWNTLRNQFFVPFPTSSCPVVSTYKYLTCYGCSLKYLKKTVYFLVKELCYPRNSGHESWCSVRHPVSGQSVSPMVFCTSFLEWLFIYFLNKVIFSKQYIWIVFRS